MSRFPKSCALLFVPLVFTFAPVRAAAPQTWDEANAAIAAANTPLEKANAFYQKAGVPLSWFDKATRADWQQAAEAIDEALKLVYQLSKDGKGKIAGQDGIYFRGGYIANQLDNYSAALQLFDSAENAGYVAERAGNRNKGAELYSNRAETKVALCDFAGAIADLDKAIALNENALWFKQRAETRFEMGDWDNAVADWKRAVALDPKLKQAEDDDDDFLDTVITAPAANGGNDIIPPFNKALLPFNKAIADNPKSAVPLVARAKYRLERVQSDLKYASGILRPMKVIEANATSKHILRDLTRAIAAEPKSAVAWRERGKTRAYFWMLNNGKGVDFDDRAPLLDFTRALNLEESNALTRFEAGLYALNRYAPPRQPSGDDKKERRKNDLQNAIMNFSRAIVQVPDASADAHFQRALAERQSEKPDPHTLLMDYSAVINQQMRGIGDAPDDAEKGAALSTAYVMRGKILNSRGQRNAALQDFDAAIKAVSLNYEARFERGRLRVARGEYDDALQDLSVVTANTNSAEAWLWTAGALDGKGETEKAKTALQEAFKRDANLKARVRGTRYDEANPTQKPMAPAPDKNDAKLPFTGTALEHKNAGNELANQGDVVGAMAEYTAAVLLDPNFADGFNNRGARYLAQDKFDLALADLNRAIEIEPKHRIAYINRADVWQKLFQLDKQRADLDRAVEYADTPQRKTSVYITRARTRFNAKDEVGALSDLELAKTHAAQNATSWSEIGWAELTNAQYAASVISFGRALELEPKLSAALVYRAMALVLVNDPTGPDALKKALDGIKPEDLKDAKSLVATLLRRQPDSIAFKNLQTLLNAAFPN